MAHGSPRINICTNCNKYILVPRFSQDPKCLCGKKSEQTTKDKIKENYNIPFFYEWKLGFDHWESITELKK